MRFSSVPWLLLMLAIGGCRTEPAPVAQVASASTSSAVASLPPITLPDLTSVTGPVRTQIRARFEALNSGTPDSAASDADRARRFGELGHVLLAATLFDEAVLCYQHAEALQSSDAEWPYLRGHASLGKGDRDDAARAFERTLTLRPGYLPARVWLGDVYLDLGRADAAQAAYAAALAREPESAAALFGAGRAALARRAYTDAVQYMEHALRVDPLASVVHYPLAMAYRGVGQTEKADALLQKRGNTAPELPDPMLQNASVVLDSAASYEGIGMQALRRQDWAGAVKAFKRGLEVAPGDSSLRYGMASAMIASGDSVGAEREFQAIVRAQPDYAKAHFSLGAIFDRQGKRADALREYEAAVRYAPNLPDARLRLALVLRQAGQLQPAFAQFEETVRLDPNMVDAWIGGAQTLVALGQSEHARDWIARGRRVHPSRREWALLDTQAR